MHYFLGGEEAEEEEGVDLLDHACLFCFSLSVR